MSAWLLLLWSVNWLTVSLVSDLMPSDRQSEVLCSRQVQTQWTRCDLSRVLGAGPTGPVWRRVFVFLWSDWLRASEYYIQRGQSLTGARRGQTVTVASVHLKTTRGRVCFRRSSSIRKPRPAASQTFGREWTHGRPTTAANQRAPFPESEGRNNKLWLEEMLILVSVYNQWIKFNEVHPTDIYQTRRRSISDVPIITVSHWVFWVDQYK